MRAKYALLLVVLCLSLFAAYSVGQLRAAQSEYEGQKWEYMFVFTERNIPEIMMNSVQLNGQEVEFRGNMFQLYNTVGNEGWELVSTSGGYHVFKRPVVE